MHMELTRKSFVHFAKEEVSLMIVNGWFSNIDSFEEVRNTDSNTIETKNGTYHKFKCL